MKRDIAAAIALEELDAASGKLIGRSKHVGSLGVASERDDGSVFEQQQHVADLACLAQLDQRTLQPQTFGVIDDAELDNRNHAVEIIGSQCMPGCI